jgi:aerobic-type carbon monoxide dehydrogenase small subunit (CoxS/CutS family)
MPVIELEVNGARRHVEAEDGETLLTVLRDRLDLTGTKYGCGEGQCGACTVLLDGRPTRSCQTRASAAAGHRIVTIEGLAADGRLHPVQEAFIAEDAMQCGYCTPGFVLGAVGLLTRNPDATEQEVARGLEGHVCRCGAYPRIVRAVLRVAQAAKATR